MSRILQPFRLRAACRRVGPPALALALAGVVAVVIAPITEAAPPPAAPLNNCVNTDNGDPVPQTLTRTPNAVNVTTADKTVAFTLGAVDTGGPGPAAGIKSGYIGLRRPTTKVRLRVAHQERRRQVGRNRNYPALDSQRRLAA